MASFWYISIINSWSEYLKFIQHQQSISISITMLHTRSAVEIEKSTDGRSLSLNTEMHGRQYSVVKHMPLSCTNIKYSIAIKPASTAGALAAVNGAPLVIRGDCYLGRRQGQAYLAKLYFGLNFLYKLQRIKAKLRNTGLEGSDLEEPHKMSKINKSIPGKEEVSMSLQCQFSHLRRLKPYQRLAVTSALGRQA